jgi:hypothetical protein
MWKKGWKSFDDQTTFNYPTTHHRLMIGESEGGTTMGAHAHAVERAVKINSKPNSVFI